MREPVEPLRTAGSLRPCTSTGADTGEGKEGDGVEGEGKDFTVPLLTFV